MTTRLSFCFALALAACGGSHQFLRANARDAKFCEKIEGEIDPGSNQWNDGRRLDVPADGAILVKVKQSNPSALLAVRIFGDGNVPLATGDASKVTRADDIHQGTYYIVVSGANVQPTRFIEQIGFKPADPEAGGGAEKSQAGAKQVDDVDGAKLAGTVDFSAMKKSQWWKLAGISGGALALHFAGGAPKGISAEVLPPGAAAEKVDNVAGWTKANIPAGDYMVHVFADDTCDMGQYEVAVKYDAGDPCQNGGDACHPESADDLKVPNDTKTGEVDFNKAKAYHWYKLTAPSKGKATFAWQRTLPERALKPCLRDGTPAWPESVCCSWR